MTLWLWTLERLQTSKDADGLKLFQGSRQGITFALADALCWLMAARCHILDVVELIEKGPENPLLGEGFEGLAGFLTDVCHVHTARACGEVGRISAELVFGYNRHPAWDCDTSCSCFDENELDAIDSLVPGMSAFATDVVAAGGRHPAKAGPCVKPDGYEDFLRMRTKLDGCLTGSLLAKDRAAISLTKVMIPAALDYPA